MEIGRPYSRLLYRLEKSGPLSPQGRQGVAELPMTVTNVAAGQEVVHHGDAPSRCTLVFGWFLYTSLQADRGGRSRRSLSRGIYEAMAVQHIGRDDDERSWSDALAIQVIVTERNAADLDG